MPKIKISKIAYGSLHTSIGDGTLAYSSGVSFKAQEVCGLYADIPPVLSTNYSSLLWKYIPDTDSFILTHVQGRHVEDRAMGRIFSYRAAFEVARSEMNRINFSVADFTQSVPRIKQYSQSETWPEETNTTKHKPSAVGRKVQELAQLIVYAIAMQRKLYISIPTEDRVLRDNGIFNTEEFNILVEAIDSIDINIRRYVSFAFCVDEHYQKALDDVFVTMYVRESSFKVPEDGLQLKFEQLESSNINASAYLKDYLKVMQMLPGAKEPMLPLSDMIVQVQKDRAGYESLARICQGNATPDDKNIWFSSIDVLTDQLRRFKTIVDPSVLASVLSILDTKKNKDLVDQLISARKPKRDEVMRIVEDGLLTLAKRKLTDLGPDADKWMRFMNELKDAEGKPLDKSRTFYLTVVDQMGEQYGSSMRSSVAEYAKAHPRNAKDPRFELIMNALHLQNKKKEKLTTEPKSPSNSQMQEEKGTATDMVAKDSERCFDEFDRLYAEIQAKEKANTKKGKIIFCLIGFILGAAVAVGACFMFSHYQCCNAPQAPAPIDTLSNDSITADSLRLDSLRKDSLTLDSLKQ